MPDYQYIPIQKDLIPYTFDITLGGRTFTFDIRYNAARDFFTVDLLRDEEIIVIGEKIVYGRVLFLNQQHLDAHHTIRPIHEGRPCHMGESG